MRFLSIISLLVFIESAENGGYSSSVSRKSIKAMFRSLGVPISKFEVITTFKQNGDIIMEFTYKWYAMDDTYLEIILSKHN